MQRKIREDRLQFTVTGNGERFFCGQQIGDTSLTSKEHKLLCLGDTGLAGGAGGAH